MCNHTVHHIRSSPKIPCNAVAALALAVLCSCGGGGNSSNPGPSPFSNTDVFTLSDSDECSSCPWIIAKPDHLGHGDRWILQPSERLHFGIVLGNDGKPVQFCAVTRFSAVCDNCRAGFSTCCNSLIGCTGGFRESQPQLADSSFDPDSHFFNARANSLPLYTYRFFL